MENLPSSYLRAHDGFCKRCCPVAEKEISAFKASDWLARAGQCVSVLRSMSLKNGFRYMVVNPLLQPLRSTTHVSTIAVAQKWMSNVALM